MTRRIRSLQFQMFIFGLILLISEIPRIQETTGLISISEPMETFGLALHTVSMGVLSGFILYRAKIS